MISNAYARRRANGFVRKTPAAATTSQPKRQPPSGALINVILEYADIRHDLGGERVILRLSPQRMEDPVIEGILGRETGRLADVSILWDDDEGAIVRILDDRADGKASAGVPDHRSELDTFELTEAALAYVARHGG
jgi:hypothetical protein